MYEQKFKVIDVFVLLLLIKTGYSSKKLVIHPKNEHIWKECVIVHISKQNRADNNGIHKMYGSWYLWRKIIFIIGSFANAKTKKITEEEGCHTNYM